MKQPLDWNLCLLFEKISQEKNLSFSIIVSNFVNFEELSKIADPVLTKRLPGRTPVQNTITGSDCEVEATKKPRKQRKDPQQESRRQEKNLVNAATTGAGKTKHSEGSINLHNTCILDKGFLCWFLLF